ncbi:MAG TPA: GIY-YIG nuclease family protein [Candidatus Acidoferrales bacterium]|nr:GIY-YIG nuclease family protein [Candidatus Acidoferrales bacterium]
MPEAHAAQGNEVADGFFGVMAEQERDWFCYMVQCKDGSLYVGIASDVSERVKRHNWGVGPTFTAKRRPVKLIWNECCGSAQTARQREKEIKGWSRSRKLALAGGGKSGNVCQTASLP